MTRRQYKKRLLRRAAFTYGFMDDYRSKTQHYLERMVAALPKTPIMDRPLTTQRYSKEMSAALARWQLVLPQ